MNPLEPRYVFLPVVTLRVTLGIAVAESFLHMIKGFRHKGLKLLFESGNKKGVPTKLADKITRRLDALDAAFDPLALFIPGFDMRELQGDRKGKLDWQLAINVSVRRR